MFKQHAITTRKAALVLAFAFAFLAGGSAEAAREADTGRKILKKWSDTVVKVHMVIESRMAMQGREMSKSDSTSLVTATVIDPSGLAVLSYSATNPGEAFSGLGGMDNLQFSYDTKITDVKIRLKDGEEIPGEVVLRDKDLDLAFVRPREPLKEPLPAVELDESSSLEVLDSVVILGRMGKVGSWSPTVIIDRVKAVIEKPRTFYALSVGAMDGQLGCPVFSSKGKCVGILLMRSSPSGGGGMSGLFSFQDSLLPVVLPAEDILEVAEQVPPRKEKKE